MTTQQVSEVTNTDKTVAYGFLRFLKSIGAAQSSTVKVAGSRGRGAAQFTLTEDYQAKLEAFFQKINEVK